MQIFYRAAKKPKNNKSWEIQIEYNLSIQPQINFGINFLGGFWFDFTFLDLFNLEVQRTYNQDHAGWRVEIKILGLDIYYTYHDIRHWDYDNDKWEEYNNKPKCPEKDECTYSRTCSGNCI